MENNNLFQLMDLLNHLHNYAHEAINERNEDRDGDSDSDMEVEESSSEESMVWHEDNNDDIFMDVPIPDELSNEGIDGNVSDEDSAESEISSVSGSIDVVNMSQSSDSSADEREHEPEVIDRPVVWRPEVLPVAIIRKPCYTLLKTIRRTYLLAARFGDEDLDLIEPATFGELTEACPHCDGLYWPAEVTQGKTAGLHCCSYGRISLPDECLFREPTQQIKSFYTGTTTSALSFQREILKTNNAFATSFVSGNFMNVGDPRFGLWSLAVNGEVRWHNHQYANRGDDDRPANHGQVYFLDYTADTADAVIDARIAGAHYGDNVERETMVVFEEYLREHNAFIRAFKTATEVRRTEEARALAENRVVPDVVLVINPKGPTEKITRVGSNYIERLILQNRYNIQPCDDFVGAVFSGEIPPLSADAFYFPREQRENERPLAVPQPLQRTLDVQMMPLIHLHGEGSWAINTQNPNKVPSLSEYYMYRIAIRNGNRNFNVIHHSKKLFMWYLIQAALKIEYDRLEYIRLNQFQLKAESYINLKRFVENAARNQNRRVGRVVVLPKGIYGSTRHMQDLFYDAVALAAIFGPPSYLITLTCNKKWPEIEGEMNIAGTDVNMRPDVCNRVFEMRANQLLSDIVHEQIFGQMTSHVFAREFQGRGLTHSHFLFTPREADRPQTGRDVDRFICAEFPDPHEEPRLFDLVKRFMVHRPCDKIKGLPCRAGRKDCKFGFPFAFRNSTDIVPKKPLYRRPDNGRGFVQNFGADGLFFIDNRYVVPYNPLLLLRYGGHLNVMFTHVICPIKYLFGYVLKGSQGNKVRVSIMKRNEQRPPGEPYVHDEVQDFKEQRHLGPYEAHYKILGNSMAHMYPPVDMLPVHLPDEHIIIHREGEEEIAVVENVDTKLTAWFKLNREQGPHRQRPYADVVRFYNYSNKQWVRANRHTYGRLMPVILTVNNAEMFYLRLLLSSRTDMTSFEDLRTVGEEVFETFKGACVALNLVQNDEELVSAMNELVLIEMGPGLRRAFVCLLVHCHPSDPLALYTMFREQMCDDFFNAHGDMNVAIALALRDIERLLAEFDRTLRSFNLPEDYLADLENVNIVDADDVLPTLEEAEVMMEALNEGQRGLYDEIIRAVNDSSPDRCFLVVGPGGTGKTTLYNTLITNFKARKIVFASCAYTGIASTLLIDGKTSHKTFGLPLRDEGLGLSRSTLRLQSPQAQELLSCKIIIWDEVSMVPAWQLHVADRILRDIMETPEIPFGGKVMLLGGDFMQILPTILRGSRCDIVDATLTSSNLWPLFRITRLTVNIRALRDPEYAAWILNVGKGGANEPNSTKLILPLRNLVKEQSDLIKFCFGVNIDKPDKDECAILTPKNSTVIEINDLVMDRLPDPTGSKRIYLSCTTIVSRGDGPDNDGLRVQYPVEFLQSLYSSSVPPHKLTLKKGASVMLIRNLRLNRGLCNGTRLRIEELLGNVLYCKILTGKAAGEYTPIYRITFVTDEFGLQGTLRRHQFPVRPCYAMNIHKSQGQTLKRVGLCLQTPPFVHGQLYVALSRVSCDADIKIYVQDGPTQGRTNKSSGNRRGNSETYTENHVYREVLNLIDNY